MVDENVLFVRDAMLLSGMCLCKSESSECGCCGGARWRMDFVLLVGGMHAVKGLVVCERVERAMVVYLNILGACMVTVSGSLIPSLASS